MTRRIEHKTSRTAEMTCSSRAASYLETNPCYKSDDFIAPQLLPRFINFLVKRATIRRFLLSRMAPAGIYEYVIARTKYIDHVYTVAMQEGFRQVLIMGAGFDTRALRLSPGTKEITIIEMDVPITQTAKINQYKKRNLTVPSNLVFIPIDFEHESVQLKLVNAGFNRSHKTLFMLEGLLMYLEPGSVDNTFNIIKDYASTGSRVVFDCVYASVLRKENLYFGEESIYKMVSGADEQWRFGIEKDKIPEFLAKYDLVLLEHLDAENLEKRYFQEPDGKLAGKINGTHCIVLAEKK